MKNKPTKSHMFRVRMDHSTQLDLAVLAKLAGKMGSAVVRDLIAEKMAALPTKSTQERN